MAGVAVAVVMVDGELAASTACVKEERVTIGGRIGGGFVGGRDVENGPCGLVFSGDLGLAWDFALGECPCGLLNVPKVPSDPDIRFEKLLLLS